MKNHKVSTFDMKNLTKFSYIVEKLKLPTSNRKNHTLPYIMEILTQFKFDVKNLSNFAHNMENQGKLTCDMKKFTNFAYKMEQHIQFTCDMKSLTIVA